MIMIKTGKWTGGVEEEYETQHFGFGAQRLKIAMRQMVAHKISNCVKEMESCLQKSLDLNEKDKMTLKHSCDKLIHLYCERAGPSMDVIDGEIESLLKIPDNVLLPEDELQINQVSDDEYEQLKEEVDSLRKTVEHAALMGALLAKEEEEISSAAKSCEMAGKDMELLDLIQKDLENRSMKTVLKEVNFMCATVPATSHIKSDMLAELNS